MFRLGCGRRIRNAWVRGRPLLLFLFWLLAPIHVLHSRISKIVHTCAWIAFFVNFFVDALNRNMQSATLVLAWLLSLALAPERSYADVVLDGPQWVLVRTAWSVHAVVQLRANWPWIDVDSAWWPCGKRRSGRNGRRASRREARGVVLSSILHFVLLSYNENIMIFEKWN